MSNGSKAFSIVPRIPLRRPDDLIDRIRDLKRDAEVRGFGSLAYFLEIAMNEAQMQADQLAHDRRAAEIDPRKLWRPET